MPQRNKFRKQIVLYLKQTKVDTYIVSVHSWVLHIIGGVVCLFLETGLNRLEIPS